MVNKQLALASFSICLVALGLTVTAIHADNWAHYEQAETIDYEFGIFWVTHEDNDDDNAAESEGLTWYSIKQIY